MRTDSDPMTAAQSTNYIRGHKERTGKPLVIGLAMEMALRKTGVDMTTLWEQGFWIPDRKPKMNGNTI